jgi:hypothetical protein
MQALGARRIMVHFPLPLLRAIVAIMEKLLPSPPVTRSLLELLAVSNVTTHNQINLFVTDPLPFTPENTSAYMRAFRARDTISQFFGK